MSKLKGIIADVHCHAWNAFSVTNEDGVNSRLQIILDEINRAADAVLAAGGKTLVIAGDLFHVRGSIAPSVLNPLKDTLRGIITRGLKVIIIPGNHDLETKKSERISSAVTSLEDIGCIVASEPQYFKDINTLVFPWVEDINDLKKELKSWADVHEGMKDTPDLILHAPIDGVIPGLPPHGLTAEWLATLGFKRVFAGHYHNHKDFGNGVYSIGAIAHHTWSDPHTKAGFLLVDEESVKYNRSHAPEFIDIDAEMDEEDIVMAIDRNYVRAKINKSKKEDVDKLRKFLEDNGAVGIVINAIREPVRARPGGATVKAGKSIETSLGEFITKNEDFDEEDKAEITARAIKILGETV